MFFDLRKRKKIGEWQGIRLMAPKKVSQFSSMMVNYNSRFILRVASRILDHNDEMDTVSLGLKFEIWKSVQNVYKFTFLIGKC